MQYSKIKTRKEKAKEWLREHSFLVTVAVLMVFVILAISIVTAVMKKGPIEDEGTITPPVVQWNLPVENVNIVQEFDDQNLQENKSFEWWEVFREVAFKLNIGDKIFAVGDGNIIEVNNNLAEGYYVVIQHNDGIRSIYRSLDSNVLVRVGDRVTRGTQIGTAGTSARGSHFGTHLRFAMTQNGRVVNPNTIIKELSQ